MGYAQQFESFLYNQAFRRSDLLNGPFSQFLVIRGDG